VDSGAVLQRSALGETSQPTPPALNVADAAPDLATGAAAFVPPAPVENLATDQFAPDHPTPRRVDVEALLAAAPAARSAVGASVPTTTPIAEAATIDGRDWTATWLGVLLMALGLVSVLSSSQPLRRAVLLRD